MGEGKKSPPPPAAVLSQPFYLAHRLATLNIRSNPAPGRKFMEVPTADELVPPLLEFPNSNSLDAEFEYHRVVNRWLYVFQERGDKWTWAGEYWVDESGDYHPVDMKLAKGKERNKRPKPTKDALKRLSLPYKINGKQ